MHILRWLHLSDFHFGKDNYDEQTLCSMIICCLRALMDGKEYPDAIFVTGDIAYSGIQKQYNNFETLLLMIDELFQTVKKPQIYIVPGNHDVDRTQNSMIQNSLYNYKKEKAFRLLLDPTKEGLALRNQIIPRFNSFLNTFKNSLCFPTEGLFSEKGYYIDFIENRGVSVGIAGINTSWLAFSDNDKEHITPGFRIVESAVNALEKYDFKILLGHHPLSWFQPDDSQMIASLLAKHNVMYMYGHIHNNEGGYQTALSGKQYNYFGAGAAFLTRDTDKLRHSIQYGELNEKGITIKPLKWSKIQQAWIPDSPEYFPADNHVPSTDYWFFPFGSKSLSRSPKRPSWLKREWCFITKDFIKRYESQEPSKEEMLMFFDGKSPEYSFAFSSKIPVRRKTNDYANEFIVAEKNRKSKCMLITGASGEGKSTLSFQIIKKLVSQDWTVLHCADPEKNSVFNLSNTDMPEGSILIVADNASIIAKEMFNLLLEAKQKKIIIHSLLISTQSEWLYSKASDLQWDNVSDFSPHTLGGIEIDEAKDIIEAWNQYGNEGLGTLAECSNLDIAAKQLYEAAKLSPTKQDTDGALIGAIIKTRYREEYYKNHVRLLLKRLQNISLELPDTTDTLLEAFARIALMHNEKLYILGSDTLAEIYHCEESDIKRKILYPLDKEAVTSKSGDTIYVRHSALANCVINLLTEEFRHIELEDYFPEMAAAAVTLRTNGKYVYKIESWRYLANHFLTKEKKRLAVRIAEAVYEIDMENPQVLSHLLTVYLSNPDPAYDLIYELLSRQPKAIYDPVLLYPYSLSAIHTGKKDLGAYLICVNLSDQADRLIGSQPLKLLVRNCAMATDSMLELSDLYQNKKFMSAGYAFAKLGSLLDHTSFQKSAPEILRQMPSCPNDSNSLRMWLEAGVRELLKSMACYNSPPSVPYPQKITFERLLNKIRKP